MVPPLEDQDVLDGWTLLSYGMWCELNTHNRAYIYI